MASLRSRGSFSKFYSLIPIFILFISVLNEFDFNYLNLEYFSFNFPFILIFFFSLKDFKYLSKWTLSHDKKKVIGLGQRFGNLNFVINSDLSSIAQ